MMDETTATQSTQDAVDGGQGSQAGPPEPQAPVDRVTELEAALEAAKGEAAANWEKYLRERAEMENYKKRIERTYADLAKRGRRDLLLKLLSPVDNLERALAYEADVSQDAGVQNLIKGLKMVYLQFKELLAGEGLTEIKTVGEKFDPNLHEAIASEPAEGKEDGEILLEVQKGYTVGDELLRPARVKVASKG